MRVYIAGRYSRKVELRSVAADLRARGVNVTSRWLEEDADPNSQMGEHSEEFYAAVARKDLDDIDRATSMLFFAEDPLVGTPRGGRHVEFGYALARGKYIDVVGPRENVFHYAFSRHLHHFPTLEEYLDFIGGGHYE
jgi:hypothetical protein